MTIYEVEGLFTAVGVLKKYQTITKVKPISCNIQKQEFRKKITRVLDELERKHTCLQELIHRFRNHILAMKHSKLERNGLKLLIQAVENLLYEK